MDEVVSQEPESTAPASKRSSFWNFKKIPFDLVPLLVLFIVVIIVILFANDWKFWDGQRSVEETNDAYVRTDVTPLSTKVAGTVATVHINDYDHVTHGQLLVELRNDDFIAREAQAKANYDQSVANIATVQRQIEVQKDRIETADLKLAVSKQEITRSNSNVGANVATVDSSVDLTAAAREEKRRAEANLKADQAIELRAQQERERQEALFKEDASTRQTVEQVVADHEKAKANVASDQAEIARLTQVIKERANVTVKQQNDLRSARAQDIQSDLSVRAQASQLHAEQRELSVLEQQLVEANARSASNLQAWKNTEIELDYTKIRAPVDGTLSERRVRAGQQVNAGTQVITIVSSVPWVIASFRETQMRKMNVGDRAEVSVDALGSKVLKGFVQSLSPASEAQFALLPPDNPSGNFTKITQRLPVKIVFDNSTESERNLLARIKPGMTVIAKVWTK